MKAAGLLALASIAALAAGCGHLAGAAREGGGAEIERSVVRIVTYLQRPDWREPWNATPVRAESGSGFVVEGGHILTNAHVVSDSRLCLFYLDGDPSPHRARVAVAGHDCDLALLEPEEAGVLRGVSPLRLGGLPRLRSPVETYGFPAGGQRLSSTRGVVSRIDLQPYVHSGMDAHLTVQTDAAINPGNSGGPVVDAGGEVVGVAFQGNARLDNVGYFIPAEVVRHFLADAADGVYGGYPELGVVVAASLESEAARARAGLAPGQTGVGVDAILPLSSAAGALRLGDVLLSVEGHAVANDATVSVGGMRLHFGVLVDRKQVGEPLRLGVLREGKPLDLSVALKGYPLERRYSHVYDELPRYFVYAGLVFVPLTRDLLEALGPRTVGPRLVYEFWHRGRDEPESLSREPVVLLRRLDHPVNARSPWEGNLLVERVNGRAVGSLPELVAALEENRDPFQVIEYAGGGLTVFRREEAEAAGAEILRRYGVPADRRL